MTGAPEQRREPVKTEDAVASFMRNTAARNWQEPTQRKFRTLLVDRLQFYTASKGYRYLNQMTLDVITEFRATDALLKLGILDGVMLCRPRQAGGQPAEGILPGHRSVACSGSYDSPSALRAREIVAEGGRGWAGSFHSADIRTEGRIIDLRRRVELYIRHSICNTSLTLLCGLISTDRFLHAWSFLTGQNDARLRRADADHRPKFYRRGSHLNGSVFSVAAKPENFSHTRDYRRLRAQISRRLGPFQIPPETPQPF